MTKSPEIGVQTPERNEKLEIREIKVKNELPGLSGRGFDSSHGSIENTKGLIVEVATNMGLYELVVLFAEYVPENDMYDEFNGRSTWELTDIKLINASGNQGIFELVEPDDAVIDQLSKAIEEHFVDKYGKWKS